MGTAALLASVAAALYFLATGVKKPEKKKAVADHPQAEVAAAENSQSPARKQPSSERSSPPSNLKRHATEEPAASD